MAPAIFPDRFLIAGIDFALVNVGVTDEFVISQGKITRVENAFVRVRLESGVVGFGEIAPFTDLTGETRAASLEAARRLAPKLTGQPVSEYRRLSMALAEQEPTQPAARCGLETAILDAFSRELGIPLWALLGGANSVPHNTDITLPILGLDRTLELARHWHGLGFRLFKTKVGLDFDGDIKRLSEIAGEFPDVRFIADANAGFSPKDALSFIRELERLAVPMALFEQPVDRADLEGMAAVRARTMIPVAADESVFSGADAHSVIAAGAADVINLKIMKSGVVEAMTIAAVARSAGLGLMIGGMMETRLAMGCSLALALGLGGIDFIDLDTPLLLESDPHAGGYSYTGPEMSVWHGPGLDMEPVGFTWEALSAG
jgi:L-alanine-DL-glutamate epimerase-like enolase superfamily enzyme